MLNVTVSINGSVICSRTVCRLTETDSPGAARYRTDAGDMLLHDMEDGAVELAVKVLRTVKDPITGKTYKQLASTRRKVKALEEKHAVHGNYNETSQSQQ